MKKQFLISIVFMGLMITGSALLATAPASAETRSGILIIPFSIHAENVQSFLKPAITDMLYTRLSAENRTVSVEKAHEGADPVSVADAIAMGQQQDVDYVLFGSITMLGTMISTDAQLVGVAQEKPLLTFNEVGQDQGEIITHMEHLTTRINETVFGVAKAVVPVPVPMPDPATDDIHTHPEKLVIPGLAPQTPPAPTSESAPAPAPSTPPMTAPSPSAAPKPTPAPSAAPAESTAPTAPAPAAPGVVVTPQPDQGEVSLSYWKSESFPEAIEGISIADVDGDGSNEIVFINANQVFVYRYENEALQEIATFSHKAFNHIIYLDTADINQNGTSEIFVTDYIASQQRVRSMVLEWNGRDFDIIDEKSNWYLRVLQTPASQPLLLGQKHGTQSAHDVPVTVKEMLFDRDVYKMTYQDGHYASAGQYVLPKGLSLYDFARGDVSNNGHKEIVSFSGNDHINVYNQKGEIAWESDKAYGGKRLFLVTPDPDILRTDNTRTRRTINYYLPQRIHITDIDRDGLNELILLKNTGAFPLTKNFKEGRIDCLSYDDIGAQLKWQTRNIGGYISDYVIGDLDNDGLNEIVLSTVAKNKSIMSKGKSNIITCRPVNE